LTISFIEDDQKEFRIQLSFRNCPLSDTQISPHKFHHKKWHFLNRYKGTQVDTSCAFPPLSSLLNDETLLYLPPENVCEMSAFLWSHISFLL